MENATTPSSTSNIVNPATSFGVLNLPRKPLASNYRFEMIPIHHIEGCRAFQVDSFAQPEESRQKTNELLRENCIALSRRIIS
jgi:hypothetical protein